MFSLISARFNGETIAMKIIENKCKDFVKAEHKIYKQLDAVFKREIEHYGIPSIRYYRKALDNDFIFMGLRLMKTKLKDKIQYTSE